jgi:hypothetical protein
MAVIRPLMPAGPILRGFQLENLSRLTFWAMATEDKKAGILAVSASMIVKKRPNFMFI